MTKFTGILSGILLGTVLAIGLLFAIGALTIYHPPQLATFHWKCDLTICNLYDSAGKSAATVISRFGSGYSAYIWNKGQGMGDFETQQEAFEFVAREELKP